MDRTRDAVFCDVLAAGVKRELNLLLWERPFIVDGGPDAGWFCREHALLVSAIAAMLGHRVEIAVGHFAIVRPDSALTSTVGGGDHAWNIVDGVGPIDASLSTRHLARDGSDVRLVCPDHPELRDPYDLLADAPIDMTWIAARRAAAAHVIAYREERRVGSETIDLLRDPYAFLLPPPQGEPSFLEAFGADALHAIAWHALLLHRRATESVVLRFPPSDDAIRAIYRRHPNARRNVEREIGRRRRRRT